MSRWSAFRISDNCRLIIVGFLIGFLALPSGAEEGSDSFRLPSPVQIKHTCQISYDGCLAGCKIVAKGGCVEECDSDCNVCSLDFGEEVSSVCRR